ncbi:hypothetical protein PY093_02500 [Cytobacillus sp. S13-E01]|uniref:hypothetical protein n=1 Tax=Cytobacillus sp. S13-E01 TaxID=3031326 RepID=UPI0023D8295F|nr:hypothetical protein [Cytobacillus sp. S13-E01]MDF0725583.1 hypothetical protein [Cytobacillus sp. S13-E01]
MTIDRSKYCLYCMKRDNKVKSLKPVYDLTDQKLVGYYCEIHYPEIIKFQNLQEAERITPFLNVF